MPRLGLCPKRAGSSLRDQRQLFRFDHQLPPPFLPSIYDNKKGGLLVSGFDFTSNSETIWSLLPWHRSYISRKHFGSICNPTWEQLSHIPDKRQTCVLFLFPLLSLAPPPCLVLPLNLSTWNYAGVGLVCFTQMIKAR